MEVEARSLAKKTKASDAKKLNDIKKYMAMLEWYKKKSKDAGKGYYNCFKNGEFKRDIRIGRSHHFKLLQQWYEEKHPSREQPDSKKPKKASVLLTEDSCFWAHVKENILSCQSLNNVNTTLEKRESSWNNPVEFGEYVMEQIENYAVSSEIFLWESSFMKWWRIYGVYIDTSSNPCSPRFIKFIDFMKTGKYGDYGCSEVSYI